MQPVSVNNINIYPFTSREELIQTAFEQKKMLIAMNAEKILHASDDTRNIINKNIGYADGIGAIMALKKKGIKSPVKIPGCELWHDIVRSKHKEKSFYLIGGKQVVIEKTVSQLTSEFPGINIVAYRNGYIKTDADKQALIKDIAKKKPDVVFVAMGSPKQELLMQEMQQHHTAVYQGLGGSFDVYTGHIHRAPQWWINNNLEWAYRLVKQPTRIKRQIHLLRFFWLLQLNKI
jgi:UDP-N-acetyl-D-mannosaminouronate:lipid I N-acetyl-D-mannosaminouronosyltransferase